MKYKITCIHNDEYSRLKPEADGSTYVLKVEAPSKAEAVFQIHEERGIVLIPSSKGMARNTAPEIYSIEEIV